jgi:hypothetical protein
MTNNNDIYSKLGIIEGMLKGMQGDIIEMKDNIKTDTKKVGCMDKKLAVIKTNLENHLEHHNKSLKIILAIVGSVVAVIGLIIKFLI